MCLYRRCIGKAALSTALLSVYQIQDTSCAGVGVDVVWAPRNRIDQMNLIYLTRNFVQTKLSYLTHSTSLTRTRLPMMLCGETVAAVARGLDPVNSVEWGMRLRYLRYSQL